jgi:hypothetical protein
VDFVVVKQFVRPLSRCVRVLTDCCAWTCSWIGGLRGQSERTEGNIVILFLHLQESILNPSMFLHEVISVSFFREYSEMHYLALNHQKHLPFRRFRKQLNLRYKRPM